MPEDLFEVSGSPIMTAGILQATLLSQKRNTVWAGPASGEDGPPAFRALTAADFGGGGLPGTGTVTSVGLSLPGIFAVSGSPVTSAGVLSATLAPQNQKTFFAGPVSGSAAPVFRTIIPSDLPDISATYLTTGSAASTYLTQNAASSTYQPKASILSALSALANSSGWLHNDGAGTLSWTTPGGGSGTVTSVGLSLPAMFTVSGSPVTSSGTLTAVLATQVQKTFFAGPASGADAAPTFRAIAAGDIPDLSGTYQPKATILTTLSALPDAAGWLHNDGAGVLAWSTPSGSGVTGPGSSTNNGFVLFNGTGGNVIKDAGYTVVPVASGGTGLSSGTAAQIPYFTGSTTLTADANLTFARATGNFQAISSATGKGYFSQGDFSASGDIPASTLISSLVNGLSFATNGSTSNKMMFAYYNQTSFKSALEWSNVASGTTTIFALKGGGRLCLATGTDDGTTTLQVSGTVLATGAVKFSNYTAGFAVFSSAGVVSSAGTTGTTDMALLRANGTGGTTIQGSTGTLDNSGVMTISKLGVGLTPVGTHLVQIQFDLSGGATTGMAIGDNVSGGPLLYYGNTATPANSCVIQSRNAHAIRFQMFPGPVDSFVIQTDSSLTFSHYTTNGFVTVTGGAGTVSVTSAAAFTSGTLAGLTGLAIRDTSAAFDVTFAATSSTTLTAGRTLTFDVTNAARTIKLTGNPTLNDWFDQSVKAASSPSFVAVTLSGALTTGAPAGGSGAGAWKVGTRISGAFTADLTHAVEIDIGGTLIRLAVLT
jgi:hypothetical protein